MKKVIKVTAATISDRRAAKVLHDMRILRDSIAELDEETYDKMDLSGLEDELNGSLMYAAQVIEGK